VTLTKADSATAAYTTGTNTSITDNNDATKWGGATANIQGAYVDLTASRQIGRVVVKWQNTNNIAQAGSYMIQVAPAGTCSGTGAGCLATDTPWTTVYTRSRPGGKSSGDTTTVLTDDITGLNSVGQYVRLLYWIPNFISTTNARSIGLVALDVYGDTDTACVPEASSCGFASTVASHTKAAGTQYEAETAGNTCAIWTGGTACAAVAGPAGNSSGTYQTMNRGTRMSFANVDGGVSGGAANLSFRLARAAVGTLAVYVKYADGIEQAYGMLQYQNTGDTTFADYGKIQVYLKAGTGNVVELRDLATSATTQPRVDYLEVTPVNGANRTCMGTPFEVCNWNNTNASGSGTLFEQTTNPATQPDARTVVRTSVTGGSTMQGLIWYNPSTSTSQVITMDVANMRGLTKMVLSAWSQNASTTLRIGLFDSSTSTWTDAAPPTLPLSQTGGAALAPVADTVMTLATAYPTVDLSKVSKLRITYTGTSAGEYRYNDIAVE
jgi:hypothetical protein